MACGAESGCGDRRPQWFGQRMWQKAGFGNEGFGWVQRGSTKALSLTRVGALIEDCWCSTDLLGWVADSTEVLRSVKAEQREQLRRAEQVVGTTEQRSACLLLLIRYSLASGISHGFVGVKRLEYLCLNLLRLVADNSMV